MTTAGTASYDVQAFSRCRRSLLPSDLPLQRRRGSFQAKNGQRYSVEACDGHRAPMANGPM